MNKEEAFVSHSSMSKESMLSIAKSFNGEESEHATIEDSVEEKQ